MLECPLTKIQISGIRSHVRQDRCWTTERQIAQNAPVLDWLTGQEPEHTRRGADRCERNASAIGSISFMSVDNPISVREAAELLAVDERAVRLMAASGKIDAVKRGNVWWLDRRSVESRRRQQPGHGRPLSAPMAWSVLLLASGVTSPSQGVGKNHHPARARRWLDSHALADHAARLRARAKRESFDAHPSELPRLAARADAMRTGISAASVVGIHGGSGDVELYAPASLRRDILTKHALEPGDGAVLMRWVPDELWPIVAGDVAPRAAVLVDLLEHDDPRARREAERELRRR